ncbi:MAG: MFS transporter [Myxococcota bacterium]
MAMHEAAAPEDAAREAPLTLTGIVIYSGPALGFFFMVLLLLLYFFKFSTDVLLIAPGVMGLIFGLSRVWDAFLDPLVGYLSDRTRSRWGRRRPWMLAACLPLAFFFVMLWSPPTGLGGVPLIVWMTVAVFGFFTATTVFIIPHQALGAELSTSSELRTRLFAVRHVAIGLGLVSAGVGMGWLRESPDPRGAAFWLATVLGLVTVMAIVLATAALRERSEYQGRGAGNPLEAYTDVWRNPHARVVLCSQLVSSLGGATLMVFAAFYLDYVIQRPDLLLIFFGAYFVPAYVLVPAWLPLARRVGKKRLWRAAMVLSALGFGGLFLLDEGDGAALVGLAFLIGIGGGCGQMLAPAVWADIIDYDEYRTGQRKEGSYFAATSLVVKAAGGFPFVLGGLALEALGFVPNAAQSEATRLGLRAIFGLFPALCSLIASLLLGRLRLTDEEHGRIRDALDARSARL